MGLGCDGDGEAGETFEVLGQIEAAVEAPFVAREVSWCVADGDRAMGRGCGGDGEAGETFEVLGQIEAAVEAPFVAREVSWCVADVDRAARAGDGALDIGEPCVGPFEIVPGRSSTT